MLGDLEQRFNSLEEGGKGLVEQVLNYSHLQSKQRVSFLLIYLTCIFLIQAKRLATQQAAKGWFGF